MVVRFGRYDDAVKALCAAQPEVVRRLLGLDIEGPVDIERRSESLPPLTTRIVDALVLSGPSDAVHVEFQAQSESGFAQRMLDYLLRLSLLPEMEGRTIDQHVVLLGDGHIDRSLRHRRLDYSFEVHELRSVPAPLLLADALLAPFAVLAAPGGVDRREILRTALELVDSIADEQVRLTYAMATVTLARIRLDPATIAQTWKDAAMTIPNLFEEIHEQGLEQGLEQMTVSLLREHFGEADQPELVAVARRLLGSGSPDDVVHRIETASSLADL